MQISYTAVKIYQYPLRICHCLDRCFFCLVLQLQKKEKESKMKLLRDLKTQMRKTKRQAVVMHSKETDARLTFIYEMYLYDSLCILNVTLIHNGRKSHRRICLSFECRERALEFFSLCVRCRVTPIDVEYVYDDFVS